MPKEKRAKRRIRPRTWIIIGVAAAIVIAAGIATPILLLQHRASAEGRTITATVGTQTLQKSVTSTGTLTPTVNDAVDFAVSGTVTDVYVKAGDTVTKGQKLAKVSTLSLNAALLQAKAQLAKAQATLSDAERASNGSAASVAQISADSASVSVAQAGVQSAKDDLKDAVLTAPDAGLVTDVEVAVGDTVNGSGGSGGASGGSSGSSTAAFTIVGTDAWEVDGTVSESDVALLAAGDQVTLAGTDGTTIFGVLREVGVIPSTSSGAAEYPVTIDVTGAPKGLYDGVSLTATIIYERRTDVLAVPTAAIATGTDGSTTVTVVGTDGTQTKATVTVGETDGTYTEITGGLTEGQTIVLATFTAGTGGTGTGTRGGFGTGTFGGFGGGTGGFGRGGTGGTT